MGLVLLRGPKRRVMRRGVPFNLWEKKNQLEQAKSAEFRANLGGAAEPPGPAARETQKNYG